MARIDFKENAKLTEEQLIATGKRIKGFLDEGEKLNNAIKLFQEDDDNIFDDVDLQVDRSDLKEALDLVKIKLGALRLDERLKAK